MADLTVSAAVDSLMAAANQAAMRAALGFDAAVAANSAVAANTAKTSNATHTGDVTGATALTIAAGAVTTAKLGGDITAAGKALLDDADAAAQRTTLGLGTAATTAASAYATAAQGANAEKCELVVACSDETTALTTGTAKVTFRMPFSMALTSVRASVTTAPTGTTLVVDINESGVSVLSTKLSIDATEKTSTTAATPAVISDAALADDAEITIDIDQIGGTIAGAGLKVTLLGTRA